MALIRLLDFAILSFLVWIIWSTVLRGWREAAAAARREQQNAAAGADRSQAAGPRGAAADAAAMTLVRCSSCGVHVPSSRTLPGPAGEVFCSEACRSRGTARQGA